MPPGKKRKATKIISRRKGGQATNIRGGTWVDCIRCGGGTNRCDLCRDNEGKVKVS